MIRKILRILLIQSPFVIRRQWRMENGGGDGGDTNPIHFYHEGTKKEEKKS